MGQSQKIKDQLKKSISEDELKKASQETADKCLKEISDILLKYNCSLEVTHKSDVVMSERILRYSVVVVHHLKK